VSLISKPAEQCLQFFWCEKVMEQAFFPAVQRHEGIRFNLFPGLGLVFQCGHGDEEHTARLEDRVISSAILLTVALSP